MREEDLVPARQEADRRRLSPGGEGRAREIEEEATVLVFERSQPEGLEGGIEVAKRDAAPGREVGAGRGPEGAQVAAHEVQASLRRCGQGRLDAAEGRDPGRRPERRLGCLLEPGEDEQPVELAKGLGVDRHREGPVVSEEREELAPGHAAAPPELDRLPDGFVRRPLDAPGPHRHDRLLHGGGEERIVARADEVERRAHERAP